jgi:hypothetical protein
MPTKKFSTYYHLQSPNQITTAFETTSARSPEPRKLNENKPTSACVPRYGQKAVMFYQTDTPKSRVKMSYHEALSAFVYLLDYADKKAAYESLSEEQPCDLMLMLLF